MVDKNNESVRLSDYRGKIIVLTFMESRCQEICPLTASELHISVPMDEEGVPQIAGSLSELIVKHVQNLLDSKE